MSVAFKEIRTGAFAFNTSTVSFNIADLDAGDLAIAHVVCTTGSESINLPSGWTSITDTISSGGLRHRAMYKVVTGADIAGNFYTFTTTDDVGRLSASMYIIENYNTITPIDDSASDTVLDSASPVFDDVSLTPTANYGLLLMLGSTTQAGVGSVFSNQAIEFSNPSWTEDYDYWSSDDHTTGMFGAHAQRTWGQETGDASFTNGVATSDNGVIMVLVKNDENATSSTTSSSTSTSTSTTTSTSTSTTTTFSSSSTTSSTSSSTSSSTTTTSTTTSTTSSTTTQFIIPTEEAATIVPILEIRSVTLDK